MSVLGWLFRTMRSVDVIYTTTLSNLYNLYYSIISSVPYLCISLHRYREPLSLTWIKMMMVKLAKKKKFILHLMSMQHCLREVPI